MAEREVKQQPKIVKQIVKLHVEGKTQFGDAVFSKREDGSITKEVYNENGTKTYSPNNPKVIPPEEYKEYNVPPELLEENKKQP